jgi:LmbE family N-acetylglucosaminyl deacetylase
MKKIASLLVVAAHPDDEILGCGGTVAALTERRVPVTLLLMGKGILSRFETRQRQRSANIEALEAEMRKANAVVGVQQIHQLDFPDNQFDSVPFLEIVRSIEKVVEQTGADTVFTHFGGDLNIDHRITFQAVLTATRPGMGCPVKALYSFEVPSSTEWAFGKTGTVFSPTVFVDIGTTLKKKTDAMACYESEIRCFPHPRSLENLKACARRWGAASGVSAAEAFELVRMVP